jgi:hypothetical protein
VHFNNYIRYAFTKPERTEHCAIFWDTKLHGRCRFALCFLKSFKGVDMFRNMLNQPLIFNRHKIAPRGPSVIGCIGYVARQCLWWAEPLHGERAPPTTTLATLSFSQVDRENVIEFSSEC